MDYHQSSLAHFFTAVTYSPGPRFPDERVCLVNGICADTQYAICVEILEKFIWPPVDMVLDGDKGQSHDLEQTHPASVTRV